MQQAETCEQCLRPKASAADLARWNAEIGFNTPAPEPDWARWLCWTKPGVRCGCRVLN